MTEVLGDGARACPGCGTVVPGDRSVCPTCSRLVGSAASASPPSVPPPAPPPGFAPVNRPSPSPGFGGGTVPPAAWGNPSGIPLPPPRPAPPKRRGWVGPLVALVLLGVAAAIVVVVVQT